MFLSSIDSGFRDRAAQESTAVDSEIFLGLRNMAAGLIGVILIADVLSPIKTLVNRVFYQHLHGNFVGTNPPSCCPTVAPCGSKHG